MIRSIDFQVYQSTSFLSKVHPLTKVLSVTCLTFFLIIIQNSYTLIILNSAVFFLLFFAGLRFKQIISICLLIFFSLYGILFSQALFYDLYPRTTWIDLGSFTIASMDISLRMSYEGLEHGLVVALRVIAPLLLTYLIFLTTSPHAFLKALRQMRIKQNLNLMITTALRFIPQLIQDYRTIRLNQKINGSKTLRLSQEYKMIKPLFFLSLHRSNELANSLLTRSYHHSHIGIISDLELPISEKIFLTILGILSISVLSIKILFQLYIYQIMTISELRIFYEINRLYL